MKKLSLWQRPLIAIQSCRRESALGFGYAARWFARRFCYRYIKRSFPGPCRLTSADEERALSVVIPASEKDLRVLPQCLRAAREMIRHRLTNVSIVAPESESIRRIAQSEGCDFIHEDEYLPRPSAELKCRGWLLQQLIKFNACERVAAEDYLVLDADTVFLRPQGFFKQGKTVLRYSDQYGLCYNPFLELMLETRRRFPVSFITHHMVFNRSIMRGLLDGIERRFKRPWHEVILHEVDHRPVISVSEFELYGNFVVGQAGWRNRFRLEYWNGLDCDAADFERLEELRRRAPLRLNSLSFHRHTQ